MTETTLKGKTAKGLFWGGLGNGIQQLLGLVFGIFIARILNANDYGMVGMLTIFSVLATNIQECGFANAIANKQVVKHEDYNAVFWFSLITGLTLYVILFFCAPFIADFYHKPELVPLARYLFLSFVFSSSVTAHNALLFRNMKVKEKTISQVAGVLVSGIVGVAMAFNGMAYWGLATQTVVYVFIYAVCMWHFSPWRPTLHINFRPLKEMLIFSSKILATNIFIQINNNIFSVIWVDTSLQ
jgi:O-antigen/teichoic acid export membrane protein